jgi:hypothetical protein
MLIQLVMLLLFTQSTFKTRLVADKICKVSICFVVDDLHQKENVTQNT